MHSKIDDGNKANFFEHLDVQFINISNGKYAIFLHEIFIYIYMYITQNVKSNKFTKKLKTGILQANYAKCSII